jgi:conjugative relaxase-like TrwC/TraI family protein
VTARVTSLYGDTAGAYYVEKPGQYYLDGDEPPGVWRGRGADELGLAGELDDEAFVALLAGLDPETGARLGTRHTNKTVRGFDITFSAPKSVSVLFAVGDPDTRAEVLAAHDAAVDAVMDWVEDHALVRHRVNGEVWIVDAVGTTSALFRQHTSRALDPQVHTHAVLVNRVLAADGRWLALDARTLKHDQRTLSALYHGGLRSELTQRLGVAWQEPVSGIAEMAHIAPEVLAEFSARTRQVDARIEVKLERFAESLGRMPTPRERWRLEREAALDSRPAKTAAPALLLHERWSAQVSSLDVEPHLLVEGVMRQAVTIEPGDVAMERVLAVAVDAVGERQSTWRPAELVREIAAAMPTGIVASATEVSAWAEQAAGRVIERDLVDLSRPVPDHAQLRRDGRPVTEPVTDRILTTPAILAQEERLLALAEQRLGRGGVDRLIHARIDLTAGQHRVAAAVAGDRELVLVVGPAGTGKTTALAPAVEQLKADGRAVFGVCPSASAADVLSTETSVAADTLDKLLIEHRARRIPSPRYALPSGATVLVDEAAMVPTGKLAELFDLAEQRGWRLALVGDPLQFSAVGRSGMFGHLVDTFGAVELDRVHRFTNEWERDASLQLRRGDTDVVAVYDQHGRLHGGTANQMRHATVDAWWQATHSGQTAAMMAPTSTGVDDLNSLAQHRRIEAGEIDRWGSLLEIGDQTLRVGDVVATRHNDRTLRTDQNQMVRNRDRWTIQHIHPDRSITVTGRTGTVDLPAGYTAQHVTLAYAETSHAAQGRTVDHSFLYLDGPTDTPGIYVPLTRGRDSNEAFVVLTDDRYTPADLVADAVARTWIDQPAIAQRLDLEAALEHRPVPLVVEPRAPHRIPDHDLAGVIAREIALTKQLEQGARRIIDVPAARTVIAELANQRAEFAQRAAAGRTEIADAQASIDRHDGPIARRLHRGEIEAATRTIKQTTPAVAKLEGQMRGIDERTRSIQDRITGANGFSTAQPSLQAELTEVSDALATDREARVEGLTGATRDLVADILGPEPTNGKAAQLWRDAAGLILEHNAAYDTQSRDSIEYFIGPQATHRDLVQEAVNDYGRAIALTTLKQELHQTIDYPELSL